MFQDYDITRIDATKLLIGIDLQPVLVQCADLKVLILEVDAAVAVLKGPYKRKTVHRAGPIPGENDRIVFFAPCNTGIKRIENSVVVGIEACLLVFPGGGS